MRETNKYKLLKLKYYSYVVDNITKLFINHNHKIWAIFHSDRKKYDGEILFELNNMHSGAISSSYLANVLSKRYNAKIVGYYLTKPTWKTLYGFIDRTYEKVYTSFGMSDIVYTRLNKKLQIESKILYEKVYNSLGSKRDVENISVDDVLLGDLIYDTYLRTFSKPTVEIKDETFQTSLKNSLEIYVYWKNYFDTHNVKAINVSHCVYNLAIPLRIAIFKDIPAFQASPAFVYRLDRNNMNAYTDFCNSKEKFEKFTKEVKEEALSKAKQRIELRFKGDVGVDMTYSSKSAYTQNKHKRLIKKSKNKKIFIALHCFFDSPHSYGYNLFPDFYEWIDFLGKISENTDYDWYLKTHPDFLQGNIEIINQLMDKYPKFVLLPSSSSHHQIIEEGIDVALTTYGTIGFEYAALGIPVINASLNNPHIAYNFNLHPKSIEEYSDLLYNIDKLNLEINKNEIYSYYYMRFLNRFDKWLFKEHEQMIDELGGYSQQFTSKIYNYWMKHFNAQEHEKIIKLLEVFIDSEDFILENKHFKED